MAPKQTKNMLNNDDNNNNDNNTQREGGECDVTLCSGCIY